MMAHWTDEHITYDEEEGIYIGWDETGADIVMESPFRDFVVSALVEYAATLNKEEL